MSEFFINVYQLPSGAVILGAHHSSKNHADTMLQRTRTENFYSLTVLQSRLVPTPLYRLNVKLKEKRA